MQPNVPRQLQEAAAWSTGDEQSLSLYDDTHRRGGNNSSLLQRLLPSLLRLFTQE